MNEPSAHDHLVRIERFTRWLEDTTSSRLEPSPLGTAVFNDDFPVRWDSNFLRVEGAGGTTSAVEVAEECERWYGSFLHREVIVEDADRGAALAMGFADLGWEVARLVYMALRRPSDRDVSTQVVEEVSVEDLRPAIREVNLAASAQTTEVESRQLTDFRLVLRDRVGARFFAASVDGEIASFCELYVHDGLAQIEDVNTLERFRGRGLARACVVGAAAEAAAAGADLVFLIADDQDWPKHLYATLGFDPVGYFSQFNRPPPPAAPSTSAPARTV